MLDDDQPTIPTAMPQGSRAPTSGMWHAPSVEQMQAMLPQYEMLEILGRGGMGAVYKARQKSLKRLVAIKILPRDAADDEMKFAERFQNEAQMMAAMNHPAIVSVHDFGETVDGLHYFVMEFVDGTDVQKMIQASGRLSPEHALAITAHVCDALAYAHKCGVIHRDIKPANILIDQEGHIKVADFGLAKMHDPAQTNGLTKTNMAMGTPDYVAPEVLAHGVLVDHRADLYAVGVMLYQMLTGEVPRGMFKLPSQKVTGSDPRFDEIICKAMEQDREERYQSAMDVRRALDEIRTTPQAKEDGTGIVPLDAIPSLPPAPVAKGKSTLRLTLAVAAVAFVSVAFLIFGSKHQSVDSSPTPRGDSKFVDSAFFAQVAAAPPKQQVRLVSEKIEALSGGALEPPTVTITNGLVTSLQLWRSRGRSEDFTDFSPIAALRDLQELTLGAFSPSDLSFLRGLKLDKLIIHGGSFSAEPLRDQPLTQLELHAVRTDFSWLKGKPLKRLDLSDCRVGDLSFVKGMPLTALLIRNAGVTDLSPIHGLPLKQIVCDFVPERDTEILRAIPTLTHINEKPVADFWASVTANSAPDQGKPIDLLALADLKHDALAGNWSRSTSGISVGLTTGVTVLELPYQPPEEYDFEMEFTPDGPGSNVNQYISAGGHSFAWKMNAHSKAPPLYGFEFLDGKFCKETDEASATSDVALVPGRRYRSTVQVRRGNLRGLLDDKLLVNWFGNFNRLSMEDIAKLRDVRHIGVGSWKRAVTFHKIIVREITGRGKVDAARPPPAAPFSTTSPDTWIDRLGTTSWATPWLMKDGALSSPSGLGLRELGQGMDVALRIRARVQEGATAAMLKNPLLQPTLRTTTVRPGWKGNYLFQAYMPGRTCTLIYLEREDKKVGAETPPIYLWKEKPLPPELIGKREIEWEFRAIGDELSMWADGKLVASVRDARLSSGGAKLQAFPGFEITKLETHSITTISPTTVNSTAPPIITEWQDVTANLQEKARSIPGAVIEGDTVGLTKGSTPQRVILTPPGWTGFAMRIHYTGGAQVDRAMADGRFDFILCQKAQVGFMRLTTGTITDKLRDSSPFPSGYDYTQPHELLVTIDGPHLRAWVDGSFMGQARDDVVTEGAGGLMLKDYCTFSKVEIARLTMD